MRSLIPVLIMLVAVRCTTPYIAATQAVQRGDELNNAGRYEEAMSAYQEFLALSPQLGLERDPAMEAAVLRKKASGSAALGRYPAAAADLRKAVALDSQRQDRPAMAENQRLLGLVNGYQGRLRAALRHLTRAHDLLDDKTTSAKDVLRASAAENDLALAQLHLTLGDLRAATAFAQSALRLALPIAAARQTVSEAQLVLGIVYRETGENESAASMLNNSREQATRIGLTTARQELALGELESNRGRLQSALEHKLNALEQAKKSNIRPQIMTALLRIGETYNQLGDDVHAQYYFRQALELQTSMGIRSIGADLQRGKFQEVLQTAVQEGATMGAALAGLRLAERHHAAGRNDSARMLLTQAKTYFEKAGSNDGLARTALEEARIGIGEKQWAAVRPILAEAATRTQQPDLLWQIEYRTGQAWTGLDKPDSAQRAYQRAVQWIDRMRSNLTLEEFKSPFSNNKVEVYDRYLQLLLDHSDQLEISRDEAIRSAFDLNEQARSRAFLDMLANRGISARQDSDTTLLKREHHLRLKIARLTNQLHRQPHGQHVHQELSQEWHSAQEEHQQLIRQIKLTSPAYENVIPVQPPSASDIAAGLDAGTALVEYWVGPEAINIWILNRQTIQVVTVRVDQKDLFREIARCRTSLSLKLGDVTDQSLTALSDWLLKPIEKHIKNVSDLVIVPHRKLHFIPFHALKSDGKYLIESHAIRYAPSAAVFIRLQGRTMVDSERLLAMALGESELEGFQPLPGTNMEVNSISKLYPGGSIQSEETFNESDLRRKIRNATQVHLATHGVFDTERPLQSYLLMHPGSTDDGHLTVNEILDLRLTARLVTLSACETGLGSISEGDELVGLSRAFLYAGSAGIIVSLWKVDDATTAWLMTRFHQYLTARHPAPVALAYAQRDLIQANIIGNRVRGMTRADMDAQMLEGVQSIGREAGRNPYYWAPFLFIGNDKL